MHAMPSDARTGVIQHIHEYALERMAPEQLRLFLPLVERYYDRVAAEDLVARAVPDLFGAALAHLRLARHRAAEPKIASRLKAVYFFQGLVEMAKHAS